MAIQNFLTLGALKSCKDIVRRGGTLDVRGIVNIGAKVREESETVMRLLICVYQAGVLAEGATLTNRLMRSLKGKIKRPFDVMQSAIEVILYLIKYLRDLLKSEGESSNKEVMGRKKGVDVE